MRRVATALVAALLAAGSPRAAPLTPREQAGKTIYLHGESPSGGAIHAQIGGGAMLPGSAVACASCHGEDGLGRPEGVVLPNEVTWSYLSKRYGHVHDAGRKHPAFDARTLARAISEGVDPAGNRLDLAMPRYSMSRTDMESLVAYMRVLERDLDPGIAPDAVRVGAVLPATGSFADLGAAIRQVLRARFEELDRGGGVNGRRIELVLGEHDGTRASCLAAARRLVTEARVFALVSGFCPAGGKELAALAEREKVPLVGPLTPFTGPVGDVSDRYVFHVVGGVREHARALVEYAAKDLALAAPKAAIVHDSDEAPSEAARAALEQARARGWAGVEVFSHDRGALDPALALRLEAAGVQVVVFLGGDADLASFLRAAGAAEFAPYVLLSGTLAARAAADAPRTFTRRLLIAYPSLPSDEKAAAREQLARSSPDAGVHPAARASAYTAATVLIEGLRRSGRHLSRERLVDRLEALFAFETGLVPPVTYGPNRHVGAMGAYVVAVDLEARAFQPVRWVALE